jgi:hypothetical protein
LDRTRQYPGSYEVLSTDKVSEAKTKRNWK